MTSAEEVCKRVSAETDEFYARNREALGNRGYRVMYGRPDTNPPILFIGYQPGGAGPGDDDLSDERTPLWPENFDYATQQWRLAKAVQKIFAPNLLETLRRCTGLNAIFVRSPSVGVYCRQVPLRLRQEVQAFCRPLVLEIINALRPRLIVGIGFESLRACGLEDFSIAEKNSKDRTLIIEGKLVDIPTLATLHLSGARIADRDRETIKSLLRARLATAMQPQ